MRHRDVVEESEPSKHYRAEVSVLRKLPRDVKVSASLSRPPGVTQFDKQDKDSVANSLATISLVSETAYSAACDRNMHDRCSAVATSGLAR